MGFQVVGSTRLPRLYANSIMTCASVIGAAQILSHITKNNALGKKSNTANLPNSTDSVIRRGAQTANRQRNCPQIDFQIRQSMFFSDGGFYYAADQPAEIAGFRVTLRL